ncbi:beta/alpha barrel domain-containing protein [Bifidobacterium vansinderenii]|uniref:Diguanylate cyclase n=1 Tax=Bifidobacterium vansinderenii TaxID=1984871 RepID=A0A229VUM5_9BIFI|nr:diguanylate cyclase [Bifidobacterium vansinderenii]OXM99332.1 diguanylate cyclase [Bifidobacterium vansinderenii]
MSEETTGITPFYDVDRTYEDNYRFGPFGAFAQTLGGDAKTGVSDDQVKRALESAPSDDNDAAAANATEPAESFFGVPVDLPFGIPAGPLLNERYTTGAFRMGFDLAVYKTVRSRAWGCNPFPNVLAVHPASADGILTPGSAECDEGVLADHEFETPISISNSFGVPSQDPDVWQPDMQRAMERAGRGQLLVPSFQGSRVDGMTPEQYVADHAATARLVLETGAKVMEMNTSCPNEGHNRLLCHAPDQVSTICEAVKNTIGDVPLIVKLAYLPSDDDLEYMVRVTAGRGLVQGFATINTISAKLVDAKGAQALPGAGRDRSGVCGAAIKPSGLDMVRRLAGLRERLGLDFGIVGVGGVTEPADYFEYRAAGADAVMSATGAMWNPDLAQRIKQAR